MFNAKKKTPKGKAKAPPEVRTDKGFERLKRKNSRKLFTQRLFYLILLAVLLIVFTVGAVAIFFRVSSVTVKGNGDIYGKDEIVEASGIKKGMNIYLVDDDSVITNLLSAFPYIKTVKVDRNIPSNVTLELRCDLPNYYFEIAGEYFVVSGDLKVVQRYTDKEAMKTDLPNIKKLTAGDIKSAIVGSELVFVNDSYTKALKELLSVLEATELFDGVSSIDLSDRFNMYIVYDSRLKANIGNSDELTLKLRFMNEVVKDLGEARGTIDIKNVEAAYVLLNSEEVYD